MTTRAGRWFRRGLGGLAFGIVAVVAARQGLVALDAAYPPPLDWPPPLSREVVDRHGEVLRMFANSEGRWRLQADLDQIDPHFIEMLVAYEDKRFFEHKGVDPLAFGRAALQLTTHGGIVSGGSTITMQLARLMEPRQSRSFSAKLMQSLRALQIERRLSKREILERYLTLAPYGGNIEGVRAAAFAWFGKEPRKLTLAEAALLVALPQAPEARRPDRNREMARRARDRVVARLADAGIVAAGEADRVTRLASPAARIEMPSLAPHLSQLALDRDPQSLRLATTLDARVQAAMEKVAADAALRIDPMVSVAIVVADARTGDILASVGSPDFSSERRDGWIDMTRAVRSPGSTLKPFIYGLALEDGIVLPETMISDRPEDFAGYKPTNFDMTYQGDVPIREALQLSLNVPAIRLLDAIGPSRLTARLRRAGVVPVLPPGEKPSLSIGLGGVGVTLRDLVQLYANLAGGGSSPVATGDGVTAYPGRMPGLPMLSPVAAWHVGDMLSGIPAPVGSRSLNIAWKTGTSYGYRDAWSLGYDGRHVIGVWVGRPDNAAVPGITGATTAGPVLFEAFDRANLGGTALPRAPAGAVRIAAADLPAPLQRFGSNRERLSALPGIPGHALHIAFPIAGTELEAGERGDGSLAPVILKLQGGTPPYRLLANGKPSGDPSRVRQIEWQPEGRGFSRLTVLDGAGRARSVEILLR